MTDQPKAQQRITLSLRHEEQLRLNELAEVRGVAPDELLVSFVADLTRSLRSNGSDERMYAEQWMNRVVWPADLGGSMSKQISMRDHAGGFEPQRPVGPMFPQGDDLPLFSGVPQSVDDSSFKSETEPQKQEQNPRLPGMEET